MGQNVLRLPYGRHEGRIRASVPQSYDAINWVVIPVGPGEPTQWYWVAPQSLGMTGSFGATPQEPPKSSQLRLMYGLLFASLGILALLFCAIGFIILLVAIST